MNRGIYSALSGAVARERSLDATAQNIANASTPGYQPRRVTFAETLAGVEAQTTVDTKMGDIQTTDRPLDVAIEGPGYLMLEGNRMTRAGNLHVSADQILVDGTGAAVMGQHGPISVDRGDVTIGDRGQVKVDGRVIDTLRIVDAPSRSLVATGNHLTPLEGAELVDLEPKLRPGAMEQPSYDVVEGMVDLIKSTRSYDALTNAISTFSELDARTARHGGNS